MISYASAKYSRELIQDIDISEIEIDTEGKWNKESLHSLFTNKLINISRKQEKIQNYSSREKNEECRALKQSIYCPSYINKYIFSELLFLEVFRQGILRKRK